MLTFSEGVHAPSRSELAARRLVDPMIVEPVAPTRAVQETVTPSRRELANAIRALSMDAVQRAESGHPGAPMGMADFGMVLWNDFLRHNPANPKWFNRDRLILSNGHGSMLLYSLLHLSGHDLTIEDLRDFRQLGSRTPGHPEYGRTAGVETTTAGITGPVGLANGGQAWRWSNGRFIHPLQPSRLPHRGPITPI